MSFRAVIAAAAAAAAFAAAANAEDPVFFAARVSAPQVEMASTAAFYERAFNLKEVNRFGGDQPVEIMLNFGETLEAAKASAAAQVVLFVRDEGAPEDTVPHFIFTVEDTQAALDKAVAAGAVVERAVTNIGDGGASMAIVVDPSGNRIELLHLPG